MTDAPLGKMGHDALMQVLGFLNYSSGAADPHLLENLNYLYQLAEPPGEEASGESWRQIHQWLRDKLSEVSGREATPQDAGAFQDAGQVEAVLRLAFEKFIPAYFDFHQDLLFHQNPNDVVRPFFLGRIFEAVLSQGGPWREAARIVGDGIAQLNDFVGHRPVATLEGHEIEPYAHEWSRPIPLYVRGAGASWGKHQEVVAKAVELLHQTDAALLRQAHFAPDLLDELAIDPRAYDFDHPVNRRVNYQFGQWDPHLIDRQGRYRRFVIQQVTLDALMCRVDDPLDLPLEEKVFEAAAVLAGAMLMASGVSGSGPDTHDSNATLSSLLPTVTSTRDSFYTSLIERMDGPRAERLRREAEEFRQPFGAARRHLNGQLARRRASQLVHVHMAQLYSHMAYPEAAARQVEVVPVASARMLCQIECRFTAARQALNNGRLEEAAALLPEIVGLLHTAIECGAVVDPWNILGFDGNFSLFPALENSIRDHRVHDLIDIMEHLFGLYARVWSDAVASDTDALCQQVAVEFEQTAQWWRQFAAHEVSGVKKVDGLEAYDAAEHVANALRLWHEGGAAAGDVRFWSPHVEMFGSPKAYALVIEALLEREDFIASMALLIHWLGRADHIPLHQGENTFYALSERWLRGLRAKCLRIHAERGSAQEDQMSAVEAWKLARKFLDFLDANAGEYGSVPTFQSEENGAAPQQGDDWPPPEDEPAEEDDLFHAAYEDVVFRDSTDDGVESNLQGGQGDANDSFEQESKRLTERLAFLECNARLWRWAALCARPFAGSEEDAHFLQDRDETLRRWIETAENTRKQLGMLLVAVQRFSFPEPTGDHESMLEFDRRGTYKDALLECAINAAVELADAARFLHAALDGPTTESLAPPEATTESLAAAVFGAMLRGRLDDVPRLWPALLESLNSEPLLFVPISKGGDAVKIVNARARRRTIQDLLHWLPRFGLIMETCQLIEAAREIEINNPVGNDAVTDFDELFKIGYKALIEYLVKNAQQWKLDQKNDAANQDDGVALVSCIEELTHGLMECWMAHSRSVRLSVLEQVQDARVWRALVGFIKSNGADLFTQKFLSFGNLRAILQHGAEHWLNQLLEDPRWEGQFHLVEALREGQSVRIAAHRLSLVLEAVVENYGEYLDYNSTTTQSDHGDMLYTLIDFLRLRSAYDRVAWNLKPLIMAHEILARKRQYEAAKIWRRELTNETNDQAEQFLAQLADLQNKYAMQLPTVADRIAERFVRPMDIDRVCALVAPAMGEAERIGLRPAFTMLEQEMDDLAKEPSGVGLDTPVWLTALDDEVERVLLISAGGNIADDLELLIPSVSLEYDELKQRIKAWLDSR